MTARALTISARKYGVTYGCRKTDWEHYKSLTFSTKHFYTTTSFCRQPSGWSYSSWNKKSSWIVALNRPTKADFEAMVTLAVGVNVLCCWATYQGEVGMITWSLSAIPTNSHFFCKKDPVDPQNIEINLGGDLYIYACILGASKSIL